MNTIKIKISNRNVSYYRNKLEDYSINSGEELEIPIDFLPKGSKMRVNVNCSNCGKEKYIIYRNYIKDNVYLCNECKYIKIKITNLERYGVENIFQLENYDRTKSEECKKKISQKSKINYKNNYNLKLSDKNYDKMKNTTREKYSEIFYKKTENSGYDYSKVIYIDMDTKVIITCPKHGDFLQKPKDHIHNNQGCPICKESKGEREIRKILDENNIEYIYQKKFDGCRYKNCLPFDFYLPDYNLCIEFDGEQHFTVVEAWGGEEGLKQRKKKDKIKTDFCLRNGIKLIRIRYDENIEEKINKTLNKILNK
jgi:very-short-patch-repair endonuclease